MNTKRASLVAMLLLLMSIFSFAVVFLPSNVSAATHYVGGPGPGNFTTIQDAINISDPGDTVFVFNGTYFENVLVNQSVNLVGEDRNTTIINGGGSGDVVRIAEPWVNLSHFTVTNGRTGFFDSGVSVFSSHNNLSHLITRNNSLGIYLSWTNNITVYDCQVLNNSEGIYMEYVDYSTVANTTTVGNRDGIYPYFSSYNKFVNNDLSDQIDCIYPDRSHYNLISGNRIRNCRAGIDILNSDGNMVIDNDISMTLIEGILLDHSDKNIFLNNTISGSLEAIYVDMSMDLTFRGNTMVGGGFFIWSDIVHEYWTSHTIDISNTVNGRPVYYWKNTTGSPIPLGAGQVLLYNSTDVIIENQNLSDATIGIHAFVSSGLLISNGTIAGNAFGAYLENADYGNITGAFMNNSYDVRIEDSHHMNVSNNTGPNFDWGIWLDNTHNSTIINNPKSFQLFFSHNNTALGNTVSDGRGFGILGSNGNFISQNTATTSSMRSLLMAGSFQNTLVNNSFGTVEMDQSSINVFSHNEFSGRGNGLYLFKSTRNMFEHNLISRNNNSGILVSFESNNNTFFNNTISHNGGTGLEIWDYSNDNLIYHNKFENNSQQAFNYFNCTNQWDNGYPSGGNYWSDYNGSDVLSGPLQNILGSDGIGDSPYVIPGGFQLDKDRYPLLSPSGSVFPRSPGFVTSRLSGNNLEDVTLVWIASPDDGWGFKTVVRYDIYRNSSYELTGQGYSYLASVPNGTYQYVDSSVGEGDPSNYFYRVCAVDFNNNSTCSGFQAGKFTRSLTQGLNLISTPLGQMNDSVEVVLQTVSFNKAWAYDSINHEWTTFMKSKPYAGGLEHILHTMGVWVDVASDSNFTVAGAVLEPVSIDLKAGWNLVGFPSFNATYSVGDLKASLPATKVEGLDPTAPPYFLESLQDSDTLQAGHGYWIYASTDATWNLHT
jgi:parallel beta-helix repeat protein